MFGKSCCQSLQIIPVSLQSLQIFPPSFPSTFLIFMDYDNSCSSIKVSIPLIHSVWWCWGGWRSQDCHGYHCCSIRFCTLVLTSLLSTSSQAHQLLTSLNKIVYFYISNNQGFLNMFDLGLFVCLENLNHENRMWAFREETQELHLTYRVWR